MTAFAAIAASIALPPSCKIRIAVAEANGWLENYRQFWEGSFERLDVLLEELKTQEKRRGVRSVRGEKHR